MCGGAVDANPAASSKMMPLEHERVSHETSSEKAWRLSWCVYGKRAKIDGRGRVCDLISVMPVSAAHLMTKRNNHEGSTAESSLSQYL